MCGKKREYVGKKSVLEIRMAVNVCVKSRSLIEVRVTLFHKSQTCNCARHLVPVKCKSRSIHLHGKIPEEVHELRLTGLQNPGNLGNETITHNVKQAGRKSAVAHTPVAIDYRPER